MEEVLATIVLYRTDLANCPSYISVVNAISEGKTLDLLVYDNSPGEDSDQRLPISPGIKIHYHRDKLNGGISKAYNFAARLGKQFGKRWLLFLDQDTIFPENFLETYLESSRKFPHIKLFAPILKVQDSVILSPSSSFLRKSYLIRRVEQGIHPLKKLRPVNSGLFVNLEAFFIAGGYNEKVRLDFSDFQFIERFKKVYPVFCVVNTVGRQNFSNNTRDVDSLNRRYAFFCEGARHCQRVNFMDHILYFQVALLRAVSLSLKNRNLIFYKTFYQTYLLKQ